MAVDGEEEIEKELRWALIWRSRVLFLDSRLGGSNPLQVNLSSWMCVCVLWPLRSSAFWGCPLCPGTATLPVSVFCPLPTTLQLVLVRLAASDSALPSHANLIKLALSRRPTWHIPWPLLVHWPIWHHVQLCARKGWDVSVWRHCFSFRLALPPMEMH